MPLTPGVGMQVRGRRPGQIDGSGPLPQRASRDGHQITQAGHARFMQAVYDGNVYTGSNPQGTPVNTHAGLSATTPVLTLYNPLGSGVNLVLWKASVGLNAAPNAATIIALAMNLPTAAAPTNLTAATQQNNLIGNTSTPKATCYRVTTLDTAPIAFDYLCAVSAASLIDFVPAMFFFDGCFVVGQGVAISWQSTTAASLLTSITWEEVEV